MMVIIRNSILLLAILLTLTASAASPEFLVGQSEPTPATSVRFLPAVASNGADFFVVWIDDRSGLGVSSIIGTRVTRDGEVLDPLGIVLSVAPSVSAPRVVWDGESYLVVWSQWSDPNGDRNVFAARVGTHGGVVMLPRMIAARGMTDSGRFLASNGTVSVVAYRNESFALKIVALDRDGNTLHHETVSVESEYPREAAVAAGTSRFVVAWNDNPGYAPAGEVIHAVALTSSGHAIDPPATVLGGEEPAIATDGTHFTIVSRKNNDWREYTLAGRTFDGDLAPVGNEHPILVEDEIEQASILWLDSSRYEVFAARRASSGGASELVSIALAADGTPQQPVRSRTAIAEETMLLLLGAGTNGSDVLVARMTGLSWESKQIVAQIYPANATTPGETKLLSWSGNAHREPAIASSPSGHFVAWSEDDGTYATRIDGDGNSLDGRGIRLSTWWPGWDGRARVAFDGTNYVVAWRDDGFIGIRYIAPLSGATVAETRVTIEGWPYFALGVSPEATYLVFNDERVRVTRIPHATHTPDPVPLAVSPEDMDVGSVAAAWNGSTLLVTWTEENHVDWSDPPATFSIRIHAARVSASLSLLDPAPLLVAETGDEYKTFSSPSVASNGTDWLIVTTFQFADVLARRVLQNGTVEGNAPVKIGAGLNPVAVWDGVRYAVAWTEGVYYLRRQLPLMLSAIQPSGPLKAAHRVIVSPAVAANDPWMMPSIASTGNGETAVAYTRVSYRPEHAGVPRSFFRVMNLGAQRGRVVRR